MAPEMPQIEMPDAKGGPVRGKAEPLARDEIHDRPSLHRHWAPRQGMAPFRRPLNGG
jgi:hypothetical protein